MPTAIKRWQARERRALLLLPLLAAVFVVLDGKEPASSVGTWETTKISTTVSTKDYGETQIVADDAGHVTAVWMMTASAETRVRRSTDGGTTWVGSDQLLLADAGDPYLAMHSSGRTYLSHIEGEGLFLLKNYIRVHRTTDFGATWPQRGTVESGKTDRASMAVDSAENLHAAYRVASTGTGSNWPIYYERSTNQGQTWGNRVEVTTIRPAGTVGGFPGGIGIAGDGRIVVGMKAVPSGGDHCSPNTMGYVYSSSNNGASFGSPIPYTTASTLIADCSNTPIGFKPFTNIKVAGNNVYAVWIGNNASGGHTLYSAVWRAGQAGFDAPVAVASGSQLSMSLPVVTVGPTGKLHVFWQGQRADGKYTINYSSSADTGATFAAPVQPSSVTFDNLVDDWIGDYNGATTNSSDVFVAYGVSGVDKGTWVTVLRGGA